ncbi:MAG TPA: tRNA (guanosine(37)-N1)-methyltransferase TrmD [Anaerolineales bacterium]|nr:tRNA (guanosine(37)-N1)-methyltransferase TrmD [Anaerolineales bacterium]
MPALQFDVFTLFPDVFGPYLQSSILLRAQQRQLILIQLHNIRDWTTDRHHITDDEPYGGGGGMVMKPEPVFTAIESVLGSPPICPVILLTPQGRVFNQNVARQMVQPALEHLASPGEMPVPRLALLCGRYEGIDERVRQYLVSDEISIGDFVLTGGELAALVVIDAISRLIPGVLGDPDGAEDDSHASGLLEYPHYTRPPEFRGYPVPEVLLSGNHARIARWRREQALLRTWLRRPDMLMNAPLSDSDRKFLAQLEEQQTRNTDA